MNYYAGSDLARAFRTVRKNTLDIAKEIPEEKYGFRAAEGTMTVAELLAHTAASPLFALAVHRDQKKTAFVMEDFPALIGAQNTYAATLKTKDQIISALEKDGESLAQWLESLDDTTLGEVVSFPQGVQPPTKTRFEMLMGIKEHEMHHRGQLMVMQRLLGMTPPLTRARQERAAAQQAAAANRH